MSDNNYQNRATVKVVRQQIHEINDLRAKYKTLMEVHLETVKKYKAKSIECDELKTEILADLKDEKQWFNIDTNLIKKWEGK